MPEAVDAAPAVVPARPVGDPNWRHRETERFLTCDYQPVPWANKLEAIPDHFVHVCKRDPKMVAYTESPAKGELDRQTPIKPGRYLARFYPNLSGDEVRALQAELGDADEVKFAITADEIIEVYVRSRDGGCMNHDASHWHETGGIHPVTVYGNSDLQVAYLTRPDGMPSARTLVWPERKRYGRTYGDTTRLRDRLERLGYDGGCGDDLEGARIRRIPARGSNRLIMPYLDGNGACGSSHGGQFGIVDDVWCKIGGPFYSNTSGRATYHEVRACECCGEQVRDRHAIPGLGQYCSSCRSERAFQSSWSCTWFPREQMATVVGETRYGHVQHHHWTLEERDAHAFHCAGSDRWWSIRNFTPLQMADGSVWSSWHFTHHGVTVDGKNYARGTEPGTQIGLDLGLPQPAVLGRRPTAAQRQARQAALYRQMMAERADQAPQAASA